MANLNFDEEEHKLQLGQSFNADGALSYHSIRYDFKPHSLNLKETATIDVESNGAVKVKIPRVEGSGPAYTEYQGCKKPCLKECVLIIDHLTGAFTLERLSSNMQVKSMRGNGNNSNNKSPTETSARTAEPDRKSEPPAKKLKTHDTAAKQPMNKPANNSVQSYAPISNSVQSSAFVNSSVQSAAPVNNSAQIVAKRPGQTSLSDESSSSSSSEDDDEDASSNNSSDDSTTSPAAAAVAGIAPPILQPPAALDRQLIHEDLQLSEESDDE